MSISKVEAAKARALITQFVRNHHGEHSTEQVSAAIGLSTRTTGQILGGMVKGELIADNGKTGKYRRWLWPDQPLPENDDPESPPTRAKVPKRSIAAKEIELEIDGITIVVGRNPTTGRFRVVLEG